MRRFLVLLAGTLMLTGTQADSHKAAPGYATLIRTTVLARLADLEPSITFWRDVMGFDYAGDPETAHGLCPSPGLERRLHHLLHHLHVQRRGHVRPADGGGHPGFSRA